MRQQNRLESNLFSLFVVQYYVHSMDTWSMPNQLMRISNSKRKKSFISGEDTDALWYL